MSLVARNIVVDGPDVMNNILFNVPASFSGFDASPIYTSISGEVTINGSYYGEVGTAYEEIEYIYSSVVLTPDSLARVALRDPSVGVASASAEHTEVTRAHSPSTRMDVGAETGIPAGKFLALCGAQLTGSPVPFDPPAIFPAMSAEDYTAGTRRDHSEDPPLDLDLYARVTLDNPYFTGSIEDGDLEMVFRLHVEMNGGFENYSEYLLHTIDASGWGSPEFRDIRGSYGSTLTDSKGIEYAWTFTLS